MDSGSADFRKIFSDYVFELSQNKLKDGGDLNDFQVNNTLSQIKDWVAMIRLTGQRFKFSFRIHFNDLDAQFLLEKKLGNLNEAYELRMGCDYLKEFCNVTVGRLRNSLLDLKIDNKLSLPIVMKKTLDATFTVHEAPLIAEDRWMFSWREGSVICSFVFELLDESLKDEIIHIQKTAEPENQIEFL